MKKSIILCLIPHLIFLSCAQKDEYGSEINNNKEQIQAGKLLYDNNCSTCHSFDHDGIGPNLSGITHSVASPWIKSFIKNPAAVIDSGDPRAVKLFEKFKVYMPPFPDLEEKELDEILSYLHTFKNLPDTSALMGIENPIPDTIPDSGIRLELEYFSQLPASESSQPLAKMTKMEPIPGTQRLIINDQRIGLYELIDKHPNLYLPIHEMKPDLVSKPGWATGMASFTFHPEFTENGLFYTAHTEPGGTQESGWCPLQPETG